jgi:cytochrome P450
MFKIAFWGGTMEFDPFSHEFFEDPYAVYRWLREEAPAYRNDKIGFWALSRHADVLAGHRDHKTFSSTHGLTLDQLTSEDYQAVATSIRSMIVMDPPEHDRMRKLVARSFTPRRIAGIEAMISDVMDEWLEPLMDLDSFDVVTDFAGPFPVEVISTLLGIPKPDRQQYRHWTDKVLEREPGSPFPTAEGIDAAIQSSAFIMELVAEKRRHPADDLISDLAATEVEREDGTTEALTDEEIAGFAGLIAAAGSETVTKLVGNGAVCFGENPDELTELTGDWSKLGGAVEEVLRYKAPSQYQGRFSVRDSEWHGVTIPAGQPVLLITGAANRDPEVYEDPDRFDIDRTQPMALGLGHGVHYCLGAHLAKLESRIAFRQLYSRWPDLEVDLDNVEYVHMSNVAGPASVRVSVV